jgi:hypothetical protein
METTHLMTAEQRYPGEVTFTCSHEACGRKIVVRPGSMDVLERGDQLARHVGATSPMTFEVTLAP